MRRQKKTEIFSPCHLFFRVNLQNYNTKITNENIINKKFKFANEHKFKIPN